MSNEKNLTQSQVLQKLYANKDGTTHSQIESIILRLVTQSNQNRVSYYKILQEFESYYLCNAIYEVLVDEILKDTGSDVLISIKSEKYQKYCDEALKKFDLEFLVEKMLPKLLHYGDYTYKINKSFKDESDTVGTITSISDDYYPGDVMGLYNNTLPVKYYYLPQVRNIRNSVKVSGNIFTEAKQLDIGEVLHFTLQNDSIKLELDENMSAIFSTPSISVGIGVLWPVIERLLLLKLREISTTAADLARLTRPTLIGADVPSTDSTDKIIEHCQKLEQLLNNSTTDVATLNGDFITAISTAMSSSYKVIPKFQSGRGDASKLNLETQISNDDDDRKLENERNLICSLAGVPSELVLSSGQYDRSSQRLYARMNKKVKKIQRSISKSLVQFMVHYVYTETKDLEVSEHDFEVVLNSSTNIEDIDDAESLGYVLDNVQNLIRAAETIKSSGLIGEDKNPIDPKRFMDYLREEFKSSGSKAGSIWLTDDEINATSEEDVEDYSDESTYMYPELDSEVPPLDQLYDELGGEDEV